MTPASASTLSQVLQYLGLIDTARRGSQAAMTDGTIERYQRLLAKLIINLSDADLSTGYDEAARADCDLEADMFASEMQSRQRAG